MEMAKSTDKRIVIIKIVVFTGVYDSNPYNTECTSLRGAGHNKGEASNEANRRSTISTPS